MANTRVRVLFTTLPTSGSTITYTIPDLGGLVPNFAILSTVLEEGFPARDPDACSSVGYVANGKQRVTATFALDASSSHPSGRDAINDRCVWLMDGAGAVDCEMSFDSFVENGIKLTVQSPCSIAAYVVIEMGRVNQVDLIEFTSGPNLGDQVDVALPFSPNLLRFQFPAKAYSTAASASNTLDAQHGYALATFDGSAIKQMGYWRHSDSGGSAGRSQGAAKLWDQGHLIQSVRTSGGLGQERAGVKILSMTATSMKILTEFDSSSLTTAVLLLNVGAAKYDIGVTLSPASTGQATLNVGFKPQWYATILTFMKTTGALLINATTSSSGWGAADIDGRDGEAGITIKDAALNAIAKSWVYDEVNAVRANSALEHIRGNFVSMEATGPRVDWTRTTSQRYYLWMAVEDEALTIQHHSPAAFAPRGGATSGHSSVGGAVGGSRARGGSEAGHGPSGGPVAGEGRRGGAEAGWR